MTTLPTCAVVKNAVFGYNEADEEEIDDVKDADTPNDLPAGFGDFSPRVHGLGSGQSSEFGSLEGERCGDEDGTESMKAIEESAVWRMPETSPSDQCLCVMEEKESGGRYTHQYLAPI